ncbi:MAG: methyltransferase domain-containing protein [Acidimicrobiales bacterium]
MTDDDRYVHGHHESVLRSHTWRTVNNSAAYLADHLHAGVDVLDIGCGPGTITVDMAERVGPGSVVGVDRSEHIVGEAAESIPDHLDNVRFEVGDTYALDYPDNSFDIVHAHQVLQHLTDPIAALAEMRRVVNASGVVAVRDADYSAMFWTPDNEGMNLWQDLYHQITSHNRVEADAGRYLLGWARQAGFSEIELSSSTWTFATDETRSWWGQLWADRIRQSTFATEANRLGIADDTKLEAVGAAFLDWMKQPDAVFIVPHGEILATK